MDARLMNRARAGLEAWQRGDVTALEPLLDPDVELLWWSAGDWDCHGRAAVLAALRDRASRKTAGASIELTEVGDETLIVSRLEVREGPEAGLRPATMVTFRDGKVVSMRQFRSRDEALAASRS